MNAAHQINAGHQLREFILGADGTQIIVPQATCVQTREVVTRYYGEYFEGARTALGQNDYAINIRGPSLAELSFVAAFEPSITTALTAFNHVHSGDAYKLATYVGPIIGHLSTLELAQIPAIIGSNSPLRIKQAQFQNIVTGLYGMAEQISELEIATSKWNALRPVPAHHLALNCAQRGVANVMNEIIERLDRASPGEMDVRIEEILVEEAGE